MYDNRVIIHLKSGVSGYRKFELKYNVPLTHVQSSDFAEAFTCALPFKSQASKSKDQKQKNEKKLNLVNHNKSTLFAQTKERRNIFTAAEK